MTDEPTPDAGPVPAPTSPVSSSQGSDEPASNIDHEQDTAESPSISRFHTDYVPPPPTPVFKNRRRLTPEEAEAQRRRRAIRRRRRRAAGFVLLGLGGLILVAGGWVGWRTYQAYTHLQGASDQVSRLQSEIRDVTAIDLTATDATVAALQSESAKAESAVRDPLFRAAGVLPWVGSSLHAIGEVTSTVRTLSTDVVPSLVQVARTLQPAQLAPKGGVIELAPIEAASPLLQRADAAVNASRVRLAAIDRSKVVAPVNSAVLQLWSKLDSAASTTATGARVARLLPPMLGSTNPRTYLVVFQNLAEARATGGIFGSYAAVRVDHGHITVVDQGAASRTLGSFDPPITQLDAKTVKTYSNLLAMFPQDVNLTPDFPTAASLFAKMYTERKGTKVDGVIATDPVALSYALKGTGTIDVGDGVSLTSQNIVPVLLSTAYEKFAGYADQVDRDAFLARATTVAFARVMSGSGDAGVIMTGLRQAVGERRVLVWSASTREQSDIAQTSLAGRLSTSTAQPSIGVFLNDGTAAKLSYYLTNAVTVTPGACQADGRRQIQVQITLRYKAPTSGLPPYVLGTSTVGTHYQVQTNVMVFAPVGGGIVGATYNGKPFGVQRGEDRAREVGVVTFKLSPGGAATFTMNVLAPVSADPLGRELTPELALTPGVHPWKTVSKPFEGCAKA